MARRSLPYAAGARRAHSGVSTREYSAVLRMELCGALQERVARALLSATRLFRSGARPPTSAPGLAGLTPARICAEASSDLQWAAEQRAQVGAAAATRAKRCGSGGAEGADLKKRFITVIASASDLCCNKSTLESLNRLC